MSRRLLLLILSLALLGCASQKVQHRDLLVLSDGPESIPLEPYVEYLIDASNTLDFAAVEARSAEFRRNRLARMQLPLVPELRAVWLRFRFSDRATQDVHWTLRLRGIPFEVVDLYSRGPGGSLFHDRSGFRVPRDVTRFPERLTRLDLPDARRQARWVYLKTVGRGFGPTFAITTPEYHEARRGLEDLAVGAYLGFTLAMALYNAFLFFALRDPSYALYVFFISAFGFYVADQQAVLQHFVPGFTREGSFFSGAPLALAELSAVLFIRSFLSTKRNQPRIDKVLRVLIAGQTVAISSGLLGFHSLSTPLGVVLGLGDAVTIPLSTIVAVRQGYRPAWYFLISVSVLATAGVFITLAWYAILPLSTFTDYGVILGAAFDMTLLSLGLADRIRLLQRARVEAARRVAESEKNELVGQLWVARATRTLKENALLRLFQTRKQETDRIERFLGKRVLARVRHVEERLSDASVDGVDAARAALHQVQRAAVELHPESDRFAPGGLTEALAALQHRLSRDGAVLQLDLPTEVAAAFEKPDDALNTYRIIQEAIVNARRHGRARNVRIEGRKSRDGASLVIRDDGRGFDKRAASPGHGLGLRTMTERARRMGAQLSIDARPAAGVTVTLRLPERPAPPPLPAGLG
jgi:signal transduction histidine kinase